MKIYSSSQPHDPGRLPLTAVDTDWFGAAVSPPVHFSFGLDPASLHFVASRQRMALCHPASLPGRFQAELWKFDVAEFFLTDPVTGHYLEFNLAPNGGWWSCRFKAPLARVSEIDQPLPGIAIHAHAGASGWMASASLPLPWLQEHLHFGPDSRLNATFILESPAQRFLTASSLGGGEPAFHRPDSFPTVSIVTRS